MDLARTMQIIHYLPLLFNYAALYHVFKADGKASPVRRQPQGALHAVLITVLAVGLLVAYSLTHSTQRVYHNDLDEFNGSFWMGLCVAIVVVTILLFRIPIKEEIKKVLDTGAKGFRVSSLIY